MPPLILGIDPGYDRIGWAIGQKLDEEWKLSAFDCIRTSRQSTIIDRYYQLGEELSAIIKQHRPDQAALESLFFFKNQKTVMKVSEARGVMIDRLLQKKIKIFEYTPLQIKQAVTGYGRADKQAVEKMVRLELNLTKKDIIDDTLDALAVMMTHQANHKLIELTKQ